MAIIVTSKYTPLSFEDKIKPMMLYKAEYDSMMDKYDKLEDEASKLAYIALQYPDSNAAKAYNLYIADLDVMATEMSLGLSPGYRRKYSDIYKRYGREITPMTLAYGRMIELLNKVQDLELKDPSIKFNFQPREVGIDSYANGNTPDLKYYSGNLIYLQSAKIFENLANDVRNNPDKWNKILGGQYFAKDQMTGYTSLEIFNIIQNNALGNEVFRSIYDDLVTSSGVKNWDGMYNENGELTQYGLSIMDDIYSNIGKGAWEAIGKLDTKYLSNQGYLAPGSGSGLELFNYRDLFTKRAPKVTTDKETLQRYNDYQLIKDLKTKDFIPDTNKADEARKQLQEKGWDVNEIAKWKDSDRENWRKANPELYKLYEISQSGGSWEYDKLKSLADFLNFKIVLMPDIGTQKKSYKIQDKKNPQNMYTIEEFLALADEYINLGYYENSYIDNFTTGSTLSKTMYDIFGVVENPDNIPLFKTPAKNGSILSGGRLDEEEYNEFLNAMTSKGDDTNLGSDTKGFFIEYKGKDDVFKKAYFDIQELGNEDINYSYADYQAYMKEYHNIDIHRLKANDKISVTIFDNEGNAVGKLLLTKEQAIAYKNQLLILANERYRDIWFILDNMFNAKSQVQSTSKSNPLE